MLGGAGNDYAGGRRLRDIDLPSDGPDTLIAGSANQVLIGGDGASNVFMTDVGNDKLVGNGGNNTFYIDGPGHDTIVGSSVAGSRNTVNYSLAPGRIYADLRFGGGNDSAGDFNSAWSTGDVFVGGTVNGIVGSRYGSVLGGSDGSDYLEAIGGNSYINAFGSTLGPGDPANSGGQDTLQAGTGDDTLIGAVTAGICWIGGSGNDQIIGGAGNDTLLGGTGETATSRAGAGSLDLYILGANFGNDTINNTDTIASDVDSLSFVDASGAGINYENLWFQQHGNDLVISVIGGTGQVTVSGWFLQSGAQQQNTQIS